MARVFGVTAGLLVAALAVSGCRDIEQNSGSGTRPIESGAARSDALVQPVQIGELGARFDACQTIGTVRRVAAGERMAVRAAPFADAEQVDALDNGDMAFVCTRSHDQRWFGIVYEEGGQVTGACGVSEPVPSRRAYDGPCRSGWAPSANVGLATR